MEKSIYDQFHETAEKFPRNLCIRFENKTLNYQPKADEMVLTVQTNSQEIACFRHTAKRRCFRFDSKLYRSSRTFLCHFLYWRHFL